MSNKKVLIVYESLTGNTRNLVEIVSEILEKQCGHIVHTASPRDKKAIQNYDLVILSSYTWNSGELPPKTKRYLRQIFVEKRAVKYPDFAVMGTGDTQFGGEDWFCRAVDAMYYYCEKYAKKPIAALKIEQNPMSRKQLFSIWEYILTINKEMD